MLWIMLAVLFLLVCYALYFHRYGGVYDSLSNARIGNVYNFEYLQPVTGTYERYFAKVMRVHKLTNEEISHLNCISKYRMFDNQFQRSNTLVTCKMLNGNIRHFYAERVINCRRPILARHLFSFN